MIGVGRAWICGLPITGTTPLWHGFVGTAFTRIKRRNQNRLDMKKYWIFYKPDDRDLGNKVLSNGFDTYEEAERSANEMVKNEQFKIRSVVLNKDAMTEAEMKMKLSKSE